MHSLPPLGVLITFCIAAKHESFTKAAAEMHVTHGAVSKAVKKLEQHFGLALFHRQNRQLVLTKEGRSFAEELSGIMLRLESACSKVRTEKDVPSLAVSCEPSLTMRWLMPRLGNFYERHPEMDIHLSTAGGPVDILSADLDIAIRRSDFVWPASYWATSLGTERIGLVCSPEYWRKNKDLPKKLLHTRTRPEAWRDWIKLTSITSDISSEQLYDHFYFSLQAAVAGLGIAVGPEPLVIDDIRQGMLVAPFGFVNTDVDYVVLSVVNPAQDNRLNFFISWLKEELTF